LDYKCKNRVPWGKKKYAETMALSFDAPMNDGDFMPTVNEIEEYREKLKRHKELPGSSTKRFKHHMSKNDEQDKQDEYDDYGRNISEQRLHQEMVPWVKVKYDFRGRLFISDDKKNKLRKLNLLK